jgi:hypothetical protein
MTKLEYTFKIDMLFKMLFVKYPELLKMLVADLLEIPLEAARHNEASALGHARRVKLPNTLPRPYSGKRQQMKP